MKQLNLFYFYRANYIAKVCFISFPEKKKHTYNILEKQSVEPAEIGDLSCTHVVN